MSTEEMLQVCRYSLVMSKTKVRTSCNSLVILVPNFKVKTCKEKHAWIESSSFDSYSVDKKNIPLRQLLPEKQHIVEQTFERMLPRLHEL